MATSSTSSTSATSSSSSRHKILETSCKKHLWLPEPSGFSLHQLVHAVAQNDKPSVRELLEKRKRGQWNENINEAVFEACRVADLEMLELLIEQGNVYVSDAIVDKQAKPIAIAAGNMDVLRFLDKNYYQPYRIPHLHILAARHSRWEIVQYLLDSTNFDVQDTNEMVVLARRAKQYNISENVLALATKKGLSVQAMVPHDNALTQDASFQKFCHAVDDDNAELAILLFSDMKLESHPLLNSILKYSLGAACRQGNVQLARFSFDVSTLKQSTFPVDNVFLDQTLSQAVTRGFTAIVRLFLRRMPQIDVFKYKYEERDTLLVIAGVYKNDLETFAALLFPDLDSADAVNANRVSMVNAISRKQQQKKTTSFALASRFKQILKALENVVLLCGSYGRTYILEYLLRVTGNNQRLLYLAVFAAAGTSQEHTFDALIQQASINFTVEDLCQAIHWKRNGIAIRMLQHGAPVFGQHNLPIRTAIYRRNRFMASILAQFYDDQPDFIKTYFPPEWLDERFYLERQCRIVNFIKDTLANQYPPPNEIDYIDPKTCPLALLVLASITLREIENDVCKHQ